MTGASQGKIMIAAPVFRAFNVTVDRKGDDAPPTCLLANTKMTESLSSSSSKSLFNSLQACARALQLFSLKHASQYLIMQTHLGKPVPIV